jgi:hypothetical protein
LMFSILVPRLFPWRQPRNVASDVSRIILPALA